MRFIQVDSKGNETIQDYNPPGYRNATNNQMELQACILALDEAKRLGLADGLARIVIHTDSTYVCDNYKTAMFTWSANRWLKREGAPVLNADLWKALLRAMKASGHRVDIEWVKGHSKDAHNRAVDKLAKKSAKSPHNAPLSQVSVRRKRSRQSVDLGCVRMQGQRLTIRIITSEYLPVQHLWKLKYEVVSKGSAYFGMVDIIYSGELLKDGHSYYVRVNDQHGNPQISRVFREVPVEHAPHRSG